MYIIKCLLADEENTSSLLNIMLHICLKSCITMMKQEKRETRRRRRRDGGGELNVKQRVNSFVLLVIRVSNYCSLSR